MEQKSRGIVLQVLKFREYDQILTVLLLNEGLVKLFFKGGYRKDRGNGAMTASFTEAEFVYVKRQSSLFVCQECTVLDDHLQLRKSYEHLQAAYELAKLILATQVEYKPSQLLYKLFISYLNRIPLSKHPSKLVSSFQLKLLRHEGLFGLKPHCSVCQEDLSEYYVANGESFCKRHSPDSSSQLGVFEAKSLFTFAFSRSFAEIEETDCDANLKQKIEQLFLCLL